MSSCVFISAIYMYMHTQTTRHKYKIGTKINTGKYNTQKNDNNLAQISLRSIFGGYYY